MDHEPTRPPPDEDAILRVVCGWCGRVLRESPHEFPLTSTGMCTACRRQFEHDDQIGNPAASDAVAPTPRAPIEILAHTRRWRVTRGDHRHVECRVQRVRDFLDAAAYEVCVLYDGQPMYARTFPTPGDAEREADDFLKDMLAAGWFPHSAAE